MSAPLSFGLFLDVRNPPQWRVPDADLLARTIEVVEHAEQLGADAAWSTEHHLLEDGYLSQPLTFAAALAVRTRAMRIGTAVVQAPIRHARHLAEQAALVDALSGGRLELGLGSGYVAGEFDAFGADLSRRYSATDRIYREVRDLLRDGLLGPGPVQDPVPMWLGYQGPRNAFRAGRLGAGVLTLNRHSVQSYLDGLAAGGHPADSARVGGVIDVIVARDPERAWERIKPHYAHQALTYIQAHSPDAELPPGVLDTRFAADRRNLPSVRLSVLTPDEAVAEITRLTEGLPARHVYFWASVANMPQDIVEEHVELLFAEVAPRVRGGA